MRRDIGTDDPRVKVRPGKGSRPRTKIRPDYSNAPVARVRQVDRGRFHLLLETEGTALTGVKARELGRRGVVVGDRVRVHGDLSGAPGSLCRIVEVLERTSELRRSTTEGDGRERVILANAQILAIVTALAQPEPKIGMIDRCLVAAYSEHMQPILVLTKADLGSPATLEAYYGGLDIPTFITDAGGPGDKSLTPLREFLAGKESAFVGHSGVGKSTLINALIPEAHRETGNVNEVTGKGRHTSVNAIALPLSPSGIVIDTPGVRSFGLSHVTREDILSAFPDVEELTATCPKGCTHEESSPGCVLSGEEDPRMKMRIASLRRLLTTQ